MKILFGASPALYSGTSYGAKVEGAPAMVRRFDVVEETARSYVLQSGAKISKKRMAYNTGSFEIAMFATVEQAVESLRVTQ